MSTALTLPAGLSVPAARAFMLVGVGVAIGAGLLATDGEMARAAVADVELTRLLRGMALLKATMALALGGAVFWRLGARITPGWFALYAIALGAMAMGPGLIWNMAHVRAGAVLLHGGLIASVLLVWRDPIVAERLGVYVRARRAALRR